ncbi:sensor histidine kinase [Cohnella terricola]|uniref:histidine kinase n=1 Tax=Cohnella terricola TaxID=1289167 RepID=A0A559J540_9BACL|nr:HAMP domain-containing sensor histidine kinase [Cohnella terricola]TVX95003.1 hypothetical protein FPZ45_24275 [Cohnella terricola]
MERVAEAKIGFARLLRNPFARNLTVILIFLFVLAAGLIAFYSHYSAEKLKREWMDHEAAVLGRLAEEHPEQAAEWLGYVAESDSISQETIEAGRRLMERYGMTSALETRWFPVIGDFVVHTRWYLLLGVCVLFLIAGWLLYRETHGYLRKIRSLAVALEDVVKHNQPMPYRLYDEGELGLLANGTQELALRLQETIEQLHREKTFLKQTVADISHQLKTPLASLTIYVDLLQGDRLDPAHSAEFLERCRHELDRMEWLTLTLLKLARLEADALEMNIDKADLNETVRNAVSSVRKLADAKRIDIRIEQPQASLVVDHDPRWLEEAIVNLLKNAIEHSPNDGTVAVSLEQTPVFTRLRIIDRGSGIDARHVPHIFKKFYRSSKEGSGVGLGLPLAKSIVEKHGGVLSVAANPSGGTIFHMTLPLHPFPADPANLTKL